MWLWNCLLWIMFCCCFSPCNGKAVRPYFSSTTVEGKKKKPRWNCWHGCLSFPTLLESLHLLWTPINETCGSRLCWGFWQKRKKNAERKNENNGKIIWQCCHSLVLSYERVRKCFSYLSCAYKQKIEEVDIQWKKMN